jgi:hypothetical protein
MTDQPLFINLFLVVRVIVKRSQDKLERLITGDNLPIYYYKSERKQCYKKHARTHFLLSYSV